MRYRGLFSLVTVVIVLSACSSPKTNEGLTTPTTEAARNPADGSIRLKPEDAKANGLQSVDVREEEIVPVIVVPARVRSRSGSEAQVFAPFPGRLVSELSLPRVGDFVTEGQHIADVEQQFMASEKLQFATATIELQANIEQAQQELDLRRTELNRAQQLYDGGAIPQKQLQTSQFELKQAESKLEGARLSKEQYDAAQSSINSQPRRIPVTAPISGTIIAADATLGQQVETAKSLFTIVNLTTVWVEAAVHERDLSRVRAGRDAEITIPGSEEKPFIGKAVTIGNLVDPQNRTVPVIFSVQNRGNNLKLEMFIEAHIPLGPPAKALLIPFSAVLSEEGAYSVYVETEPGVYRRKMVQLGQRNDGSVAITSGLNKGEKVVSVGAQTLLGESRKGEIPAEEEEK